MPWPSPASFHRIARYLGLGGLLVCQALSGRGAERWITGRTEHFEMYSSASEAESRRILVALEQFRANFLTVLPLRGASEPRTTIVVFASDAAFRPYQPLYEGKPKSVTGYFLAAPDEVAIAMTSDVPRDAADPREVIYHEYVHLLLHVREARFPVWLNEGLAEVFSTFQVVDGKVEYGAPKDQHVQLLQHTALLPLARLFAVTRQSPEYNEENRIGIFYAESWAFTHYLLFGEDKSNAPKLNRFAQRLAAGDDIEPSFREAFGSDFKVQDSALRRYLDGGAYFKRGKPAVAQAIAVEFHDAQDVARDAALLNLRWRVHRRGDAAAEAHALLERAPGQARPHELLAAIAAEAGDMASAQEHWRLAAERGSDNPWVYVQLLRAGLETYLGAAMLDVRLAGELVEPRRAWASRALALSPGNADALELALLTEALAEKMDIRVINQIQRRASEIREPARAFLALAIIHWRGNDPVGARTLLDLASAQPKADMSTRAAATALRYRLPPEEEGSGVPAEPQAKSPGIALQSGRVGEAAKLLDRLLAERGSTAPRFKLDPVRMAAASGESDPWRRAEALRQKAMAGDADAMFDLAVAHACGTGVEFSPLLATGWLQKAVDHGNALAKAGLPPSQLDPELVAQFLRKTGSVNSTATLPPLDQELNRRIDEAAKAADRASPVTVYRSVPRFPDELRRTGRGGEVLIRFAIATNGHPHDIQTTRYSDAVCAAAASECVRDWRFVPAIRDGRPASTLAEVVITFEPAKRGD